MAKHTYSFTAIPTIRPDKVLEKLAYLERKHKQRNAQIRGMRSQLKDLLDFLGDATVEPPIPEYLRNWMIKEVQRI